MNLKTLIIIGVGFSVFLGIYLFSMLSAIALLVGVGLGVLISKSVNDIFKNFQKGIYLSEKANISHRKKELESELEKLNKGD